MHRYLINLTVALLLLIAAINLSACSSSSDDPDPPPTGFDPGNPPPDNPPPDDPPPDDPPPDSSVINILTLGNSRVDGNSPQHESYRYEFWKNLVSNEWEFDLIGPFIDEANYPEFMSLSFDPDHGGVSGAVTQNLIDNLPTVLADIETPDVVLLGIGGNDLLFAMLPPETVLTNIATIIDQLQNNNENIVILLEQIAPGRSDLMTDDFIATLDQFNSGISQIATEQTDTNSSVFTVDMASDWSDNNMADQIHYNATGAKIVADRYYQEFSINLTKE